MPGQPDRFQGRGARLRSVLRSPLIWVPSLLLLLPLIAIAIQLYWVATRTTEQDITDLIDRNLSTGASAEEIIAFLDAEGIEHTGVHKAGTTTQVSMAGYPEDIDIIAAGIENTSRWWLGTAGISIYFILDSTGRLEDYIVKESYTTL